MTLLGTVVNCTIVLDQPCPFPQGSRVEIVLEAAPTECSPLGEMLLRHAGTATGLPEDMAEQHDHYLHGTSRQ
jgi:hypothetical protein